MHTAIITTKRSLPVHRFTHAFCILFMSTLTLTSNEASAFSVRIQGSGIPSVNTNYEWKSSATIPKGFAKVCLQNQWDVETKWDRLNGERKWLHASNDAYIYLNSMDNHWWIDEPNGRGVFVAPEKQPLSSLKNNHISPPMNGWKALNGEYNPLPNVELFP